MDARVGHQDVGQDRHVLSQVEDIGALEARVHHGLAAGGDDRDLPATAAWTAVVPPSMNTSSTSSPCLRNRPASWATHSGADWPPTVNQATFSGTSGRLDSDGAVVATGALISAGAGALAAGAVARRGGGTGE